MNRGKRDRSQLYCVILVGKKTWEKHQNADSASTTLQHSPAVPLSSKKGADERAGRLDFSEVKGGKGGPDGGLLAATGRGDLYRRLLLRRKVTESPEDL